MLRPLIKGLWKVTHFARSAKVSNLFWYFWFYPENLSYWKRQIKEIDKKRGGNAWCALEVPGFVEIWAWKVWVIFTFRSQLHCKRKVTFACILGQLFLFCPLGKISPFVLLWMYLGFELFLFTHFFLFFLFFLLFGQRTDISSFKRFTRKRNNICTTVEKHVSLHTSTFYRKICHSFQIHELRCTIFCWRLF